MVNNGRPTMLPATKALTDAERTIAGPCHDLATIQGLAKKLGHKCITVVTKDAQAELAGHFMDAEDLKDLILELKSKCYHNSAWCKASTKSPWFAADAYRLTRIERDNVQKVSVSHKYYLKLSISPNGQLLLFFSVHRDLVT